MSVKLVWSLIQALSKIDTSVLDIRNTVEETVPRVAGFPNISPGYDFIKTDASFSGGSSRLISVVKRESRSVILSSWCESRYCFKSDFSFVVLSQALWMSVLDMQKIPSPKLFMPLKAWSAWLTER